MSAFDAFECSLSALADSITMSRFDAFNLVWYALNDSNAMSVFDAFECSLVHLLVCLSACYCMFSAANHIKLLTLSQ